MSQFLNKQIQFFIFWSLIFFIFVYDKTFSFIVYASENNSDISNNSSSSGGGGNFWGLIFIILAFALIVELTQFKKTPAWDSDFRDENGDLHKFFDVTFGVSDYHLRIFHWGYPWYERTQWLDWFSSHWFWIQHSLSLSGGVLLFFYLQRFDYFGSQGSSPTQGPNSNGAKKKINPDKFKEKIEKKEFKVIKKNPNSEIKTGTDLNSGLSTDTGSTYLDQRRSKQGVGLGVEPKPRATFFRPDSPDTKSLLNSGLAESKSP